MLLTGQPRFASYAARPCAFALGVVSGIAALVLFRLTHKALGKMWSVSLQLKQDHKLITTGIYKQLRHPMYTAFWLMALTQALLLPNYIAGLAGLVGFGFLFFSRIGPEEAMMQEAFGEEYTRTARAPGASFLTSTERAALQAVSQHRNVHNLVPIRLVSMRRAGEVICTLEPIETPQPYHFESRQR